MDQTNINPGTPKTGATRRQFLNTASLVAGGLSILGALTLSGCGGKEHTEHLPDKPLFDGEFKIRRVETGIVGGMRDGFLTALKAEIEVTKPGSYRVELWGYEHRGPDRLVTANTFVADQVPHKFSVELESNFNRCEVTRVCDGKTIEHGTLIVEEKDHKFAANGADLPMK